VKRDRQPGLVIWPFALIGVVALLVAGGEALAQQLTRFLADVLVAALDIFMRLIGAIFGTA